QKGASLDDFQGNSNVTFKSTTGHIDLPVMLRATFGRNGQFFAELGPQVSYLVSNRDFTQTGGTKSAKNTSTEDLNRVGVGYASGLGYNFSNGLSLGIRTSNDISKVYKDGNSKSYLPTADLNGQNSNARNLALQFQVQYALGSK
ncbi:MAG: PorT family protein, partial [Hymenobacter sp.]|nr:PorT family protein [Hymenobacter sp.]